MLSKSDTSKFIKKIIPVKASQRSGTGKPVAPDLWIIDKNNQHRFIESKLPGDKINDRQIAGLALIKKYLGAMTSVSVSIVCLYTEGSSEPKEKDYSEEFSMFFELC